MSKAVELTMHVIAMLRSMRIATVTKRPTIRRRPTRRRWAPRENRGGYLAASVMPKKNRQSTSAVADWCQCRFLNAEGAYFFALGVVADCRFA